MKKGEVALITISPEYAFGSSEAKQELAVIPPNSTVCYEVELVSFIKVREHSFSTSLLMKKLILMLKDIVFVLFDAGERVMGHEHTRKDRSRWQEEGRRKCIVQGWKIRKSFKEIREGLDLILIPPQYL